MKWFRSYKNKSWFKENSVFATIKLPELEYPISNELYKWFVY